MPPLGLAAGVALIALFWLTCYKTSPIGPLVLLLVTLMFLGADLLLSQGAPKASSLLWFVIFPPMVMFTMGLRLGTLLFSMFYIFLVLVMATPLNVHLAEPLEKTIRLRFLLAMFGAFLFSWCAEYTATGRTRPLSTRSTAWNRKP